MKEYWQRNPKKYLTAAAKSRARKSGLAFDITPDDFEIPERCPILGIELSVVHNGNQDKTAAPSLDRIDPNFGYIKGNVAVISWQANKYKSNMSKEIIEKLYKYVFETF